MKATLLDLFCGTGGFSHGFRLARPGAVEVRLGLDVSEPCLRTFAANHPDAAVIQGDIRRIGGREIAERTGLRRGKVDVIAGGPPCQGFSSIRPFRSSPEEDPRNGLFEPFAAAVEYFRPRAVVMENVVGLATHKGGETLERILERFRRLGYDCDWKILNAANFGVPQRRERLILLAFEKGTPIRFPSPCHASRGDTIGHRDASRLLLPPPLPLFPEESGLAPPVTVMDAISDLPPVAAGGKAERYGVPPRNAYQAARRRKSARLTLHEATGHSPRMLEIIRHSGANIGAIPKGLVTSGFSSCYSRLDGDAPAVTLTVNFVHPASNRCIHPEQDRALTPREGARLQSFDDDFIFIGTRSEIVRSIGNAVPPLLGKAIGGAVLETLGFRSGVRPTARELAHTGPA